MRYFTNFDASECDILQILALLNAIFYSFFGICIGYVLKKCLGFNSLMKPGHRSIHSSEGR